MKSKVIKVRNIPNFPLVVYSVRVKPMAFLIIVMIAGLILLFFPQYSPYLGALLIAISIFLILLMPDRKLIEYTSEYAIAYNCKNRDECKLLYWDEMLSWQYRWHSDRDEMIIEMIDHSTEVIEAYKKSSMIPYFRQYAPNKEYKMVKGRRVKA